MGGIFKDYVFVAVNGQGVNNTNFDDCKMFLTQRQSFACTGPMPRLFYSKPQSGGKEEFLVSTFRLIRAVSSLHSNNNNNKQTAGQAGSGTKISTKHKATVNTYYRL